MPLDTSIIRQATFQPMAFNQPSRMNELAQAAQAVSGLQGLQRNALAMREDERQRAAMTSAADIISKARGQGISPDLLDQMGGELMRLGDPRFFQEGQKLSFAALEMRKEEQLRQRDESLADQIRRGNAQPSAPSVMPAPQVAPPRMGVFISNSRRTH